MFSQHYLKYFPMQMTNRRSCMPITLIIICQTRRQSKTSSFTPFFSVYKQFRCSCLNIIQTSPFDDAYNLTRSIYLWIVTNLKATIVIFCLNFQIFKLVLSPYPEDATYQIWLRLDQ